MSDKIEEIFVNGYQDVKDAGCSHPNEKYICSGDGYAVLFSDDFKNTNMRIICETHYHEYLHNDDYTINEEYTIDE